MAGKRLHLLFAGAVLAVLLFAWPGSGLTAGEAAFAERVIADFSRAAAEAEREAARRAFSAAVRRHFDLDHIAGALLPGRWRGLDPGHRDRIREAIVSYIVQDALRRWEPGVEARSEVIGVRQISGSPGVAVRTHSEGRDEVAILVLSGTAGAYRVRDTRYRGASLIADLQSRIDNVRPIDMSTPERVADTLDCRLARRRC